MDGIFECIILIHLDKFLSLSLIFFFPKDKKLSIVFFLLLEEKL